MAIPKVFQAAVISEVKYIRPTPATFTEQNIYRHHFNRFNLAKTGVQLHPYWLWHIFHFPHSFCLPLTLWYVILKNQAVYILLWCLWILCKLDVINVLPDK